MASEPRDDDGPQRDGQDEWDEVVLDEGFVRGAEVREDAARTRMLRERWKHQAPQAQPWRADAPAAGAIGEPSRRSRRRRWFRRKGPGAGD
jgi:hypothetical protein